MNIGKYLRGEDRHVGTARIVNPINNRIAKLHDQAVVLSGNNDYVAGELDSVKFAELIIRECADVVKYYHSRNEPITPRQILQHFGVEE